MPGKSKHQKIKTVRLPRAALYRLIQYGDRWRDDIGPVKIMAVVDGWVMCRRPGCMPFCESMREFEKQFTRLTNEDNRR